MTVQLPDFYQLSRNAFNNGGIRTTLNPHNAAVIFQDLLDHTPGAGQLTKNLPSGLVLDLLHAQLPIIGAKLGAQYLRQLTAFRKQYPSYTIFEDINYLGSYKRVSEIRDMFSISRYMEADYVAMDALKNFCNPESSRPAMKHQRMYGFLVNKMENYIPFFVLRPVLNFANMQNIFTNPDAGKLEYLLRALTSYYLVRDVDLQTYTPDAWVEDYLQNQAPARWRKLLATPLVLP